MTTWRDRRKPHRLKPVGIITALAAACASLVSGCGTLPSTSAETEGPVVVMTWAPEGTNATNMPGMPAMAQAYARWINKQGGIGGHQLKVLTCNERNDTVGAGRCARRAVAHDVVAVVGSYSQHGRSFMSQLEGAGIPYIGGFGVTSEEFSSPLSYPVNGGMAALLAGNGRQLAHSCEQTSLVRPDTIAGDEMPSFFNAGLHQGHRPPANDIRAPEDASDYTAHAQRALEQVGADPALYGTAASGGRADGACITAALGDRTDTFFDSFRRLQLENPRVRLASLLGSVSQSLIDRTGGKSSALEGASVTGWYPVASDPHWEPMRRVVRQEAFNDNRIDTADPGVQTTWIAYSVLRAAIEKIGHKPVTAQAIQRVLDGRTGGDGIDTGGLTPKLSWRYEDMHAVRDFPRITNAMVTYQEVRGGKLVAAHRGFVNVAKTLESRPEES